MTTQEQNRNKAIAYFDSIHETLDTHNKTFTEILAMLEDQYVRIEKLEAQLNEYLAAPPNTDDILEDIEFLRDETKSLTNRIKTIEKTLEDNGLYPEET